MLEVLLLAFALSMDAFAISLCLGAKSSLNIKKTAFVSALYFGIFQAIMPLIGFFIGKQIVNWFKDYDHWVAFAILFFIGFKMIKDSFKNDTCEFAPTLISHKSLFFLAIATSIDALTAGLTLNFMSLPIYLSVMIIGVATFVISFFGVFLGKKTGVLLEKKAELLGGIILIIIGIKILFDHDVF